MQCGSRPKTSTRRARRSDLCLINQLRRESAGLLRSLALLWRGDSLCCSIVQQDGAGVISGAVISGDTVSHLARCSAEPALDCGCEITEEPVTGDGSGHKGARATPAADSRDISKQNRRHFLTA